MNLVFSDAFAGDAAPAGAEMAVVQTAPATGEAPYALSQGKMLSDTLVFVGLLFCIFYFVLIRPQQRRVKAHDAMIKSIEKGSKVMTGGGILGTVVKLEDNDLALVEIAQGVRVRVARGTISQVMDSSGPSIPTANDN